MDDKKNSPVAALLLTLGKGKAKPKDEGDDPKKLAARGVREALAAEDDRELAEALETFVQACKPADTGPTELDD